MCIYTVDHTENRFSLDKTKLFVTQILVNHFKLDFFLNDSYRLDSKYVPKELHGIINYENIIVDSKNAEIINSIFTLNNNLAVLLKLKIDFDNKLIQLFPIELKYNPDNSSEHELIEELIVENNIEITDTISIVEKNAIYFNNSGEGFQNVIIPTLTSLMNLMNSIWGIDDIFWGTDNSYDVGVSNWFKKLCCYKSRVTIHGILFSIPDSLILEYFESDDIDINREILSESSKKYLEDIEKSIRENSEFFNTGFVPKFTWSTPTDAIWINPNRSICCRSLEDIFIILKASTKVSEDIDRALERGVRNTLLLREFIPTLNEMFEFRVFIGGFISYSEYKILGISQRHTYHYYKELSENFELKTRIISCIVKFFSSNKELILQVLDIFNTMFVAFDIYISLYKNKRSVLIIDIQPLLQTSPLLFNRSELKINLFKEGELGPDILRTVETASTKNMINSNCLKGFVPEELLYNSSSDFYNNDIIDEFEWIDNK